MNLPTFLHILRASNGWKLDDNTTPINHGADNDQNIVQSTGYDAQGRVQVTRDHRNNATRTIYDVFGRQVMTIAGYVPQGASDPAAWVWSTANNRWENGTGVAVDVGADKDQNRISATAYDLAGRVVRTRDAGGVETRYEYDTLGRRTKTITNYVDDVYNSSFSDEDLISVTDYNQGGQVVTTTDARGTKTAFTYDAMGRQCTVTQAATSALATTSYMAYDKAGRLLRTVQNWRELLPGQVSPDARDGAGNWLFVPTTNGEYHDQNRVSSTTYDRASRPLTTSDPLGNSGQSAYFKDGQVQSVTDAEGMVTVYRYDGLRRRTRVVQGYVANGEDPSLWRWDTTDVRWERSNGTSLTHGTNNDQNIIVDVAYDKGGRMTSLREPRGHVTTYSYDNLNRRKSLTNPLAKAWTTTYENLVAVGTRTTMTYPNGATHQVQREFDRFGRLKTLAYLNESPKNTPDVRFRYDVVGNRTTMSEYTGANFTNRVRETLFAYDDVRRLTAVNFDNDGNGTTDQTVGYQYDAGGLRTRLTLPGNLNVVYTYDEKGQLVSLSDWDNQATRFAHDSAGRLIASTRANGPRSRYGFDAAGRLRLLRHDRGNRTLAQFTYEVDKRGNRTQATEYLANPATTSDLTIAYNDAGIRTSAGWTDAAPCARRCRPGRTRATSNALPSTGISG